jgi:hypothetical protein
VKQCIARVITVALKMLRSSTKATSESSASPREKTGMMLGQEREVGIAVIDIELQRFAYHPEGTLGLIDFEGERFYTIERPWLDNTPNVSCIPEGAYNTGWRDSPRFGETWHIKEVQDRTYILIHAANFPKEVQGCIGLGLGLMGDRVAVSSSRKAVARFEELTRDLSWRLLVKNAPFAALSKA